MNPNQCRIALRPRDLFEVFDLTIRLIRERLAPLTRLATLVLGPWALLFASLSWWFEGAPWLVPAALMLGPALQAPFTLGGGRLLFGDDFSAPKIAALAARRSPGLWFAWSLQALFWSAVLAFAFAVSSKGIWALTLVGIVGGSLTGLVGTFVSEAVILEQVGFSRAMRRSNRLAGSAGGGAAGAALGRAFLTLWTALAAEALGQSVIGFVFQLGAPLGALAAGQATPYMLWGVLLANPLIALYRLLLYVDARTRSEGWDLQVRLRALGMG